MPLFYNQLRVLDAGAHAALKLHPGANFAFARETNSIPLGAEEFFEDCNVKRRGGSPLP